MAVKKTAATLHTTSTKPLLALVIFTSMIIRVVRAVQDTIERRAATTPRVLDTKIGAITARGIPDKALRISPAMRTTTNSRKTTINLEPHTDTTMLVVRECGPGIHQAIRVDTVPAAVTMGEADTDLREGSK